jgi:hypothetical protein
VQVTVRHSRDEDGDAIDFLAGLNDAEPPPHALVAEVEGEVVAVVPLDGSAALVDPERPIDVAVDLLPSDGYQRERRPRRLV